MVRQRHLKLMLQFVKCALCKRPSTLKYLRKERLNTCNLWYYCTLWFKGKEMRNKTIFSTDYPTSSPDYGLFTLPKTDLDTNSD